MAANNTYIGSPDDPRTTAIVSYITFIGWIIACFFLYRHNKTQFSAYHLRQSLLIHIFAIILNIVYSFTLSSAWIVFAVLALLALVLFFIWLRSFIHALDGKQLPAPLLGKAAERIFKSI